MKDHTIQIHTPLKLVVQVLLEEQGNKCNKIIIDNKNTVIPLIEDLDLPTVIIKENTLMKKKIIKEEITYKSTEPLEINN